MNVTHYCTYGNIMTNGPTKLRIWLNFDQLYVNKMFIRAVWVKQDTMYKKRDGFSKLRLKRNNDH